MWSLSVCVWRLQCKWPDSCSPSVEVAGELGVKQPGWKWPKSDLWSVRSKTTTTEKCIVGKVLGSPLESFFKLTFQHFLLHFFNQFPKTKHTSRSSSENIQLGRLFFNFFIPLVRKLLFILPLVFLCVSGLPLEVQACASFRHVCGLYLHLLYSRTMEMTGKERGVYGIQV